MKSSTSVAKLTETATGHDAAKKGETARTTGRGAGRSRHSPEKEPGEEVFNARPYSARSCVRNGGRLHPSGQRRRHVDALLNREPPAPVIRTCLPNWTDHRQGTEKDRVALQNASDLRAELNAAAHADRPQHKRDSTRGARLAARHTRARVVIGGSPRQCCVRCVVCRLAALAPQETAAPP